MSLFRLEDNNIVLDAPYCEFYIPQSYFDSTKKFAEDFTETIKCLGIFNVGVFNNGKLEYVKNLAVPSIITINVYDSDYQTLTLYGGKTEKFKVCKYLKDQVLFSAVIVQNLHNVELFLNAIISGALPDNIPYGKAITMWRKNIEMNGVNLGVSSSILELILSVVFRNPKTPEEKFCKMYGKNLSVSEYAYQLASIRQICQYASTFTSIIYEDFDSMVTSSINRAREGKIEAETPIEKIVKM